LISIVFLCLISLPFIFAQSFAGADYVFGGLLFNPIDGNTYLAKMVQGWRGDWIFKLPYTAEPGDGAYLNLFYISLGHLARITNIPLLLVFHIARIISAILLYIALWRFIIEFRVPKEWQILVLIVSLFGSGMGWILFPFGVLTSDFAVPETYPFFSSLVNVHFPLGLALMLFLLLGLHPERDHTSRHFIADWWAGLYALLLAFIDPFGLLILISVLMGLICFLAFRSLVQRKRFLSIISKGKSENNDQIFLTSLIFRLFWIIIFGMPLIIYDLWVTYTDPILAGWNTQNITPSPPIWDLILSLSPALFVGIVGGNWLVKNKSQVGWLLISWVFVAILLIYFPVNLQRRLMKGLFVPVILLMGFGLDNLKFEKKSHLKLFSFGIIISSFITNLLILSVTFFGIQTHAEELYLRKSEARALLWIKENTPSKALILSSPQIGLFIPAHTGRRVIYGHPFETVNAVQEGSSVVNFFASDDDLERETFLQERQVDYVFYGPREAKLGMLPEVTQLQIVFDQEDVKIYQMLHEDSP